MKKTILLIGIFTFTSCGQAFMDSSNQLTNNVLYIDEGSVMKYILIDGVLCDKSKICEIKHNIIAINKDDNFIILTQNPSLSTSTSNYDSSRMELNFWIISKPDTMIYGPMSYRDYCIKRKELEIPNDLKLEVIL